MKFCKQNLSLNKLGDRVTLCNMHIIVCMFVILARGLCYQRNKLFKLNMVLTFDT